MAGTTISTSGTVGTLVSQNPVLVTSTGTIITVGAYAIDDTVASAVVTNDGVLSATGTGAIAVELASSGTVDNYGIIEATGTIAATGSAASTAGIDIGGLGTVVNGAGEPASWLITGATGISIGSTGDVNGAGAGYVTNDGTIIGTAVDGIDIGDGGSVANGSASETGRSIQGVAYGVAIYAGGYFEDAGTVDNFGSIGASGTVDNGSTASTGWSITGAQFGVQTGGGTSTVDNYGTIEATGTSATTAGIDIGGTGRVLATRGQRGAATPVIVRKGALGDNVPHHDLRVTKAHSLYLDGVLIPVEFLVNHRSIHWDDHAQEVTLYHVELETHDILLANGAPAESYRDDGNRWLFQNANPGWDGRPAPPYAPVTTGGAVVDTIWQRLLQRAGPRPGVPLTDDPDLRLQVNGKCLHASKRIDDLHVFTVPAPAGQVRILSRAAAPQELGLARDPRSLGVALRRIIIRQGSRFRTLEASDALLAAGFYPYEATNGIRWTNGNAVLPSSVFDQFTGPVEIVLQCGGTTRTTVVVVVVKRSRPDSTSQ